MKTTENKLWTVEVQYFKDPECAAKHEGSIFRETYDVLFPDIAVRLAIHELKSMYNNILVDAIKTTPCIHKATKNINQSEYVVRITYSENPNSDQRTEIPIPVIADTKESAVELAISKFLSKYLYHVIYRVEIDPLQTKLCLDSDLLEEIEKICSDTINKESDIEEIYKECRDSIPLLGDGIKSIIENISDKGNSEIDLYFFED